MPTRSIDIGQVEAIVQDFYLPAIRDNYFLSNAVFWRLKKNGRVRHYNGGRAIFQPLSFAPEGGGVQWWSGVDKMDTRVRNPITGATFYRKNGSVNITITRDEEDSVGTDGYRIAELANAKMNIAKPTLVDGVGTELFNVGADVRRIGGLGLVCGSTSTTAVSSSGTYGGIAWSGSSNTWWSPQTLSAATVTGASSTFAGSRGFGSVGKMWNKIRSASGKSPSMILSNTGPAADFHDSLAGVGIFGGAGSQPMSGGQRFIGRDEDMARAGFDNFMYKTAAWVVDERAPQDATNAVCYFINEDTLSLVVHQARDMSLDGWYTPPDQRVRIAYIDWSGELVCSERRANGVAVGINITGVLN